MFITEEKSNVNEYESHEIITASCNIFMFKNRQKSIEWCFFLVLLPLFTIL